jgi:hypothetical protein
VADPIARGSMPPWRNASRNREARSGIEAELTAATTSAGWELQEQEEGFCDADEGARVSATLSTASTIARREIPRPATLRSTRSASVRRMSSVSTVTALRINSGVGNRE